MAPATVRDPPQPQNRKTPPYLLSFDAEITAQQLAIFKPESCQGPDGSPQQL